MEATKRKFCIKALNLNQSGYGINGNLTRQEWQAECVRMLLTGAESFNQWQLALRKISDSNPKSNSGSFEWELSYADNSKPSEKFGWSDTPSFFVVDVTNHVFEETLFLSGYVFLTGALFNGATFNKMVSFDNATFEQDAYFIASKFNDGAIFSGAIFKHGAVFNNACFYHIANFNYSKFEAVASFECVEFQFEAHFQGTSFNIASFDGVLFSKKVDFSGNSFYNENKLQTFGRISFSGTHFREQADFSNREFKGSTSFEEFKGQPTQFDVVPLFHNCELHQDTTFIEAIFPLPSKTDKSAARAYNTLRHAMNQQQSTREEQRFLKLELDAERLMAKDGVRQLYWIYKQIADYGFSVWRPALTLLTLPILCFGMFYGSLTSLNHCTSLLSHRCQFDVGLIIQTVEFTLLQSLPPLGLDKMSDPLREELFQIKHPISSFVLVTLVVIQKILALFGWFFVALALRNIFKMK